MELFDHKDFDGHEQVLFCTDQPSGLTAIIAIHSTVLGPAAGGCRMHPYASTEAALKDVLRLSRGMTLKNACAGLPLGGGKCVIIGDPASDKKEARLRAMARHVARLHGAYWTAIDVGVSAEDADIMAEECDYIFARASQFSKDFQAADFTSLGGFHSVRAVANFLRGTDDLKDLRVAVQGAGQTGSRLIAQLVEEGAQIVVADVNQRAVTNVVDLYGVTAVTPDEIHQQDVDIFAPCAMGGVLNSKTLPELNCKGIAGLANNQLETSDHGRQLMDRNIAYAPDFVVNSGGVMGSSMPIFSKPDKSRSIKNVENIYHTVSTILARSRDENQPTSVIAEEIAFARIRSAQEKKPV